MGVVLEHPLVQEPVDRIDRDRWQVEVPVQRVVVQGIQPCGVIVRRQQHVLLVTAAEMEHSGG